MITEIKDLKLTKTGKYLSILFVKNNKGGDLRFNIDNEDVEEFVYRLLAKKSNCIIMFSTDISSYKISAEFDKKNKLSIYVYFKNRKEYVLSESLKVLFVNKLANMYKGSYYKAKEEVLLKNKSN